TAVSPKPLTEVRLDLKVLYRNSPAAFIGCMLIGIANGAWGTLGAVYGAQSGISTTEIAIMVSVTIASGALMQIPVGRISDLVDRRFVLAGVGGLAALVGLFAFLVRPTSGTFIIITAGFYGALAYALYPVAVAHANDHASSENFVKVSGGLLLLYGFGTMLGPLLGALSMSVLWPSALFAVTAIAHILITAFAMFRYRKRASVPQSEKDNFKSMPSSRGTTQEVLNLDPRAEADS